MKILYPILLIILLIKGASAQSLVPTLEINPASIDASEFVDISDSKNKTKYIKFVTQIIEENQSFRIRILASAKDSLTIIKSPKSFVHKQVIVSNKHPITDQEIDVILKSNENVEYDVTIQQNGVSFIYSISITTESEYKPNANFIFLSAIRSVAGQAQTNEFFDLNLKFNYLGRWFTLFGLDLSLSPADSGQLRINEGLVTVNCFWNTENTLFDGSLSRAFFMGAGAKIFNQEPYLGVHVGSLEINGPLFSSYALIGYYVNAYGGYATIPNNQDAINFRNNIYSEFTLAFDNKKNVVGILSDIRIKLGMMFPFTNNSKDIVKPGSKDIQYRLVLEVPIGGIFKFSQNKRKN